MSHAWVRLNLANPGPWTPAFTMHSSMIVGKDCVLVLNFSSTPFYFFEIFSITGQCFETKFQSMLGMSTEEMGELWNESYCENYGNGLSLWAIIASYSSTHSTFLPSDLSDNSTGGHFFERPLDNYINTIYRVLELS